MGAVRLPVHYFRLLGDCQYNCYYASRILTCTSYQLSIEQMDFSKPRIKVSLVSYQPHSSSQIVPTNKYCEFSEQSSMAVSILSGHTILDVVCHFNCGSRRRFDFDQPLQNLDIYLFPDTIAGILEQLGLSLATPFPISHKKVGRAAPMKAVGVFEKERCRRRCW